MLETSERPRLGPYILTRQLSSTAAFGRGVGDLASASPFGRPITPITDPTGEQIVGDHASRVMWEMQADRFLALHSSDQTSHLAYRFGALRTARDEQRFEAAARLAAEFSHPHALAIQQFGVDVLGHPWVITPFAGDVDGVRPLSKLLKEKGGQMLPGEAERAVRQLLECVRAAYAGPDPLTDERRAGAGEVSPRLWSHGPVSIDEVIVDRHGSLLIELYGLAAALCPSRSPSPDAERDEVRSIVEIGYELVTGLRAEEPIIPAHRLVRRLPSNWSDFFDRGLDPSRGFDTARAALESMPSAIADAASNSPIATVRRAFGLLRTN